MIGNVDPDPDPGGQKGLTKNKKNRTVLFKCWTFLFESWRFSAVAGLSFFRPRNKYVTIFFNI
jgi:hypothetical protein